MPRQPTFHPFPNLPKELRLQIIELCVPGPRVITITSDDLVAAAVAPGALPTRIVQARASAAVPAILSVNSEMREVALKSCPGHFENQLQGNPVNINFAIDTLCFVDYKAFLSFLGDRDRTGLCPSPIKQLPDLCDNVKHIAIGAGWIMKEWDCSNRVFRLPLLKTVTLIDDAPNPTSNYEISRAAWENYWRENILNPKVEDLEELTIEKLMNKKPESEMPVFRLLNTTRFTRREF